MNVTKDYSLCIVFHENGRVAVGTEALVYSCRLDGVVEPPPSRRRELTDLLIFVKPLLLLSQHEDSIAIWKLTGLLSGERSSVRGLTSGLHVS